jgi:hypothetical protein
MWLGEGDFSRFFPRGLIFWPRFLSPFSGSSIKYRRGSLPNGGYDACPLLAGSLAIPNQKQILIDTMVWQAVKPIEIE